LLGSEMGEPTVVTGASAVVGDAVVVAGVAVPELPPHPEATNINVSATVRFLTD